MATEPLSRRTIHRALEWYSSADTGTSSETIMSVMEGIPVKARCHPWDPADLGRCIRLCSTPFGIRGIVTKP